MRCFFLLFALCKLSIIKFFTEGRRTCRSLSNVNRNKDDDLMMTDTGNYYFVLCVGFVERFDNY